MSEIIPDNISPAICEGISMLFSLNSIYIIVFVLPTGIFLKFIGSVVPIVPILW